MNKIKILAPQEALKIAAGEVIERPSNIVKEVIENSIDAQSTQISLYIEDSGKKLIRILDNGCGMTVDDAKLCFINHATSKIDKLDDLLDIHSFGFRGEALASISTVSKVTLITKTIDSELGVKIEYSENKLLSEQNLSCATGTDLQINDLFYNIPVRKKFLKQDETEWNQILNTFNAFCLSNTNIHFKLYKDEKLIINAPAVEKLNDRVSQLFGHNFGQNLISLIEKDLKEIQITGLISNHNFWQYGKHKIFIFVNNRYIKDVEITKALVKGYSGVLPPMRFPAGFIFINVPADFVDINVHPKKEEVRFLKPNTVNNFLQNLVKESLDNNIKNLLGKTNSINNQTNFHESDITYATTENNIAKNNFYTQELSQEIAQDFASPFVALEETKIRSNILRPRELEFEPEQSTIYKIETIETRPEFKIIGQFLSTYIISENNDNLVLIDQHAAHERIIYDELAQNFENKSGIRLMFPEIINLNEQDIETIKVAIPFLNKQGIELELFGKNQIAIKSSPPKIQNQSLKELVFEILESIKEFSNLDEEAFRKKLNDKVHAQISCKAAVKAGDTLSFDQMENIVKKLSNTTNPLLCPHGRPTTWILNKSFVEKNFKRK
ncbi:DNA mismatch repair endonuclease MutL [Candidatus Dependentiae bacterium]|nr:DNA mismatch repair endonuclease MutL [Candidatus Dependentiae bacterium]MBU4387752.1 DNA mismatch repair endonuclease MutL [Candidatus Dependentiae bacterium]MCG2756344.1 DNA mismatch repair endonuclease MutL [Candidatus Dependentiae bacterium]